MGIFKNNKKVGLISDIIRCDESSYLIWKWRPDGKQLGEDKREYAIRCGSPLRVRDGEVAVFVYKQKNGVMQDYIIGPYDEKIKTSNLPILTSFLGAFLGGDTPFQAEIYFINLAKIIQVKFAVPYFDVCDPRYPDYSVPVAVRGTISFKIDDYREFIKIYKLESFDLEDFQKQISDLICRYVKDAVANAPTLGNIPVVQIEAKTGIINDIIEQAISNRLKEAFGVVVASVDIGAIEIDKSSENYSQLVKITKDITAKIIYGQAAANIEHYTESLRVEREEGQYAAHKKAQSDNIDAYRIEKQSKVGIAGAEALGKMGSNNAGGVNLGNNNVGFNPATIMTSMAVGGVVGQNIASMMNNSISGIGATPPPVPTISFYVAQNGKSTGPYEIKKITQMVAAGEITTDTLVWKHGMTTWEKAIAVEELKGLFPPPII